MNRMDRIDEMGMREPEPIEADSAVIPSIPFIPVGFIFLPDFLAS